jgi:hypothetical protein
MPHPESIWALVPILVHKDSKRRNLWQAKSISRFLHAVSGNRNNATMLPEMIHPIFAMIRFAASMSFSA